MALEYLIVIAIIIAQVYSAYRTFIAVRVFENLFPTRGTLKITRHDFLRSKLETTPPDEILKEVAPFSIQRQSISRLKKDKSKSDIIQSFLQQQSIANGTGDKMISVGLITGSKVSEDFDIIAGAINTYLLRNSGAAADFNLMKDIAERQNDAVEDKIVSSVSVPLYLGLLGTLIGIVMGLFNISGISTASNAEATVLLDKAIPTLLGGVKVAMFASLCGLALTVLNNAFAYKHAKASNAALRNDFYTFLQVELLPVINQNLDSTLRSLQTNLLQFNEGFGKNMGKLDGLMSKNYDALIAQSKLLDTLQELDMMQMAQANVKVLKELQKAAQSFEGFNAYLGQVNSIFNGTTLSITKINEFLERTKNLEALAERAIDATDMNQRLVGFLQSHYSELDKSRQLIADSVSDVNGTIQTALDDLSQFTREKINEIRSIEVAEEARIAADYQHRWESLDHLKQLDELPGAIKKSAVSNIEQLSQLTKEIIALRTALIKELTALREEQKSDDGRFMPNKIFSTLFIKKNGVDEKE